MFALYWDQLVYKSPQKPREFPWHQDNGYVFIEPQQYLTIWLALTDATVDNGCPWVAPGGHRHGTLAHRYVHPLGLQCFDDHPDATPAPVAAGGGRRVLVADAASDRPQHLSRHPQDLHPPVRARRRRRAAGATPTRARRPHAFRSAIPTGSTSSSATANASVPTDDPARASRTAAARELADMADRADRDPADLVPGAGPGSIVAGLVLGLITSLVSLGMYLVYRANRVLNFTAAELGLLPAVLSVMLIIESGLSWYLGFGLGFIAAAVLGVAVEFLIIRRFFDAPPPRRHRRHDRRGATPRCLRTVPARLVGRARAVATHRRPVRHRL